MIRKGSRYEKAVPFKYAEGEPQLFPGIRPRAIGAARPVLEHLSRKGERHDLLSVHYYNEPSLWWRVLDANPDVLYAGDLDQKREAGEPLLVPRAQEPGTR